MEAAIVAMLYIVPSVIAGFRWTMDHSFTGKQLANVVVTDYLLGWTVIGWFVALAMACYRTGTNAKPL